MAEKTVQVAVLGAGALGLTAAYRLAQRGLAVTVIEREKSLGGLAAGFPVGNTYLDRFYHHIFRTDREIIALLKEIGLGDDLLWLHPRTSVLHQGRIHQLDSATSVLRFSPLGLFDRLRMGAVIAALKVAPDQRPFEGQTADEFLRLAMGRQAYETAWRPLLEGKFGARYREISMAWYWARVHDRTASLGYLRGSFQALYDRLGAATARLGGRIRLGESVVGLDEAGDGSIVVSTAAGEERFASVLSTLPTRVTLALTRGLPEDFRRQYDWGDAYGAHCLILALDRQLMADTYWLNVNDPGFPFLAVVEHTNMMPPQEYGDRRLVYLGNYLPMDHPLFARSATAVLAEFLPHLKRINPSFEPSWVQEHWLFKAPYAQPIVTREFPQHIPPHRSPLRNLWLANMFQVYPHDRGQNYSIALASKVAGLMAEDLKPG